VIPGGETSDLDSAATRLNEGWFENHRRNHDTGSTGVKRFRSVGLNSPIVELWETPHTLKGKTGV